MGSSEGSAASISRPASQGKARPKDIETIDTRIAARKRPRYGRTQRKRSRNSATATRCRGLLLGQRLQFTQPHVAIAHGVAVVLQGQRAFFAVVFVRGDRPVLGAAVERAVRLGEHAIVKDGDVGRGLDLAVLPARGLEDDVVGLPFTRLAAGIDQRWPLAVERGGLAIGVGFVFVTVEHLDFIGLPEEKHAAVAAALVAAAGGRRCGPLDVQLDVRPIRILREEIAGLRHALEIAVLGDPLGVAVAAAPLREIFAIEEHDRVARRIARFFPGRDNWWLRAGTVVDVPFGAGNQRGVLVAEAEDDGGAGGEKSEEGETMAEVHGM